MSETKGDSDAIEYLAARNAALTMALDEIALMVSYIVTHGVSDEPSPPPEGGGPQVQHVTPAELGHLIHRIGNIARAARDGHSVKEGAGHD